MSLFLLTVDCSEIVFHIVTTDDSPIHALLKTSRINPTALVAVDPVSFEELQMWDFRTLTSMTVNYENDVSLTFSYVCPKTKNHVEDEVKLFSVSAIVLSEVKPFLDSFLKLRLGDVYLGIKIEEKPFDAVRPRAACVSESAQLKYVFPHGGNQSVCQEKAVQSRPQPIPFLLPSRPDTLPPLSLPTARRVKPGVFPLGSISLSGTFPRSRGHCVLRSLSEEDISKEDCSSSLVRPGPPLPCPQPPPVNLLRPGVVPSR